MQKGTSENATYVMPNSRGQAPTLIWHFFLMYIIQLYCFSQITMQLLLIHPFPCDIRGMCSTLSLCWNVQAHLHSRLQERPLLQGAHNVAKPTLVSNTLIAKIQLYLFCNEC